MDADALRLGLVVRQDRDDARYRRLRRLNQGRRAFVAPDASGRSRERHLRDGWVERVVGVDVRGHHRIPCRRRLHDARLPVGERQLIGVAAGASGTRRTCRRVRGIPRIEHVAGHERPRDADSLVARRQRHRSDRHPEPVDPDQRQRAGHHGREDRRTVVRDIDDDPDGALVAGVPLLGMTQERPVRAVDHHVGASLERLGGGRPELDLPVDLLERVGRHDQRERLLRAVGHAAQLLDEVRQCGLGGRHIRREHVVERMRADAMRLEVALDEAERVVDPLTEPAADRTSSLERRARRPHHGEPHESSNRPVRTPAQGVT